MDSHLNIAPRFRLTMSLLPKDIGRLPGVTSSLEACLPAEGAAACEKDREGLVFVTVLLVEELVVVVW